MSSTLAQQFELTHEATGKASADGLVAAHVRLQLVSPQAHAAAQAWLAAQFASARHALTWLPHLSREQLHADGHANVLQSMSSTLASRL